ncbi:hypothetical protein MSAN_00186800 [Mycena sanguinolenta]|uniref:Uncharacterized protein n=1 Tax=Mycena sanguinolenta TaxID=230812 RepID=A0A8H6ZEP3_9AGAR|nr:hypothetical protein MSAN_00186800 [Mycena sanguinolenta]
MRIGSKLPQELVDMTIDCLGGHSASLKACSLVSRAWISRSRSCLFETCFITPENVLAFRDLMRSPCCTFIRHIRSIQAERRHGHKNDGCFSEIAPNLRLLENVRSLKLMIINRTNDDVFFLTGFMTAFPNVTHLVITGHLQGGEVSFSQPVPLFEMICLFPSLQSLHIPMISGTLADPPASAVPPPRLHILNLGLHSPPPILAWLRAFGHLPNIRKLVLAGVQQSDIPYICEPIQELGSALHHLEIKKNPLGTRWLSTAVQILELFTSVPFPHLKTLVIRDLSAGTLNSSNELTEAMMRITAPALESLSFTFDLLFCRGKNWTMLDTFLSPAQFPRLRNVMLQPNSPGDYHATFQFLRTALPLLTASGLLALELP